MPSSVGSRQRRSFLPRADAAVLQTKHHPPSPSSRPTVVAPILDAQHADLALTPFSIDVALEVCPTKDDIFAPAAIPAPSPCWTDRYLFPTLTQNERLRLTMLFYYTRGALDDAELQSRLMEKVNLASETIGWEFVIAGLLNHNTYTRMVTVGLPLAVLPRRESTCAHTVNQPPGTVFSLLNMVEDWRFKQSPHVEEGGLRAYAGVPLRFETEFGEHVAFGSLCVASNSPQASLDKSQQQALARLADGIVSDIIHSARTRQQRERRQMMKRLADVEKSYREDVNIEERIVEVLRDTYPNATVDILRTANGEISLEDSEYFDQFIEEQNHQDLSAPRVVRVISAQCASQQMPTFLVVGSKDFRDVYDDIDSWFVTMCASILCRYWQSRALREALDAKETFLRGITHQLRTPIHGILGTVELLTEELKSRNMVPQPMPSSPSTKSDVDTFNPYPYIQTIHTATKELISTINSLIKLNQWTAIAQAERMIALHKVDEIEDALLEESLAAMPEDISIRPSINFHRTFPQFLDILAIDLHLLIDCIQPLIVSAIQNTAGGVIIVTLSFMTDTSSFIIDVEDNGCGIVLENQELIFNGYKQADSQAFEDRLGLALAGKSAKLMNGSISLVSSEIGKGSHFRAVFDNVPCASSFPPRQLLKEKLTRLPPVYHEVSPTSTALSLCKSLCRFLTSNGYSASEQRDSSLMLLECTQDLSQLSHHIRQIPSNQVAICLLSESAKYPIDFQDSYVKRDNNIIYLKSPLLGRAFEAALEVADEAMAEMVLPSLENGEKSVLDGEVLDATKSLSKTTAVIVSHLETQHQNSILPPNMQIDVSQSFARLCVRPPSPGPSSNTKMHPAKPMTLLVDDNAVNLRLLEMYCKRRSIPYQAANDGEQAVRLFSDHYSALTQTSTQPPHQTPTTTSPLPFDLILMDLQMPICDGITATSRIRALERENGWRGSIIFIVTGQDSQSDRASAEEAGVDGYLVKPVGPKALDRWIGQWFPDGGVG